MANADLALMSHLMRRAGFGATRDELDALAANGYDAVVEDLLFPERFPQVEDDVLSRYYPGLTLQDDQIQWAGRWIYRMVNTKRPLEEKMALFWHHVFATAWYKSEHTASLVRQIELFRRVGLSDLGTILTELSKDPAMIYWLDNSENHRDQPNENYGRELLELFSMGVGNYTEQDLKMAAKAFTGWTFTQPIPIYPYGNHSSEFVYREDDHDYDVKSFLGEVGRFNGEDIISIIVRQSATAKFICRHLYSFFVADEVQVPAWNEVAPEDPEAIESLVDAYFESGGDIRSILRVLFHSDFFKEARFRRVKSPTELVAGTIKMVGTNRFPEPGLPDLVRAAAVMGQELLNPPTVEGWHTGKEWIDGGTLNERINFAVNQIDVEKPGVRDIIDRLSTAGRPLSPEEFVDACLDLMGPLSIDEETRRGLLRHAHSGGELRSDTVAERQEGAGRVERMLQLIVSSKDYQFA